MTMIAMVILPDMLVDGGGVLFGSVFRGLRWLLDLYVFAVWDD
jgi:hypothetical protein